MEAIQKFVDGRIVRSLPPLLLVVLPDHRSTPSHSLTLMLTLSLLLSSFFAAMLRLQDFQAQRLADRIMQESLILAAVVAFLLGYFTQNMQLCMLTFGVSTLVVALVSVPSPLPPIDEGVKADIGLRDEQVTVPAWPFYKRYHVEWLPASAADKSQTT